MADDRNNTSALSEAVNVAQSIRGAVKTGKSIAGIAKGAAVGGPYGAALLGLWQNRQLVVKIVLAAAFIMLLPILFIMMLPSLLFGGLDTTYDKPIMNNDAAIYQNVGEAEIAIRELLTTNHDDVIAEINEKIAELDEGHAGVVVDDNSVFFDTALILSQYCASRNYKEININDLRRVLRAGRANLYSYTETVTEETNAETEETTTVHTYTVTYSGDDYYATSVFHLTTEQMITANEYAVNMMLYLYGSSYQTGVANVSAEVLAYDALIRQYAELHGIPAFVELLKAVMMQESGGRGSDPMQSSECPYNTRYPTGPGTIQDPEYSIDVGIKYLAYCLSQAGCTSPSDRAKLSMALQGYNYGNGYISWAQSKYGGYTQTNAVEFSNMMKVRLGWSRYGDTEYVPHVLRYYYVLGSGGTEGFGSPFAGMDWRLAVTSEFGSRTDPITGVTGAYHSGIDIAYPIGTPINAISGGTVLSVVHSSTGYGNHIKIDHGNGIVSLYGHCSTLLVTVGQTVSTGDIIAKVGNTGRSTGPHLHLTVTANGVEVNPRIYIQ